MKVSLFNADNAGNGWYRILWPAAACAQIPGIDVTVHQHLPRSIDAHVVVIQRPLTAPILGLIDGLQHAGIAVVIEIDDDIVRIPPKHPLKGRLHSGIHPTRESTGTLVEACMRADLVTTTTHALADLYAPHGRYAILPNCIPAERIDAGLEHRSARTGPPTVGYAGAMAYHDGDLEQCGRGIQWAQQARGFDFVGVGGSDILRRLRVTGHADDTWHDMHDLGADGYIAHLARIDIGLVPLQPCAFNDGKSDLRGLEYAALGIPFVASPTPAYLALAEHGIGVTARTPHQWRDRVLELIDGDHSALREPLIEYARSRTYESNAWRWVRAWQQAADNRSSVSSCATSAAA